MNVIQDIMNTSVVTIRPEATLADAVNLLTEHHFSGVPVVSNDGTVVGIISELDLLDVLFDVEMRSAPVSLYMNRDVSVVRPQDELSRAAHLFALFGIRRLPVVVDGKLVGIITRRDLLRHALDHDEPLHEPISEMVSALGQYGSDDSR